MPPQKNSGAKRSKKESGVASKNRRFIQALLDDVRNNESVEDIYIGRVIRKLGNGRVEVFYIDAKGRPQLQQSSIRGSFRGKGKHAVWIDNGSVVVIADSGIGGASEFEIMAVLSHEQIHDLSQEMDIDARVLALHMTDEKTLMSGVGREEGFVFEGIEDIEEEIIKQEERNKARPKPELDELNIDDI